MTGVHPCDIVCLTMSEQQPKRRKVVQISALGGYMTALCDDGTAWIGEPFDALKGEQYWKKLPDVPQGEVE